jgi:uncharacterized protein (DUF2062 family)
MTDRPHSQLPAVIPEPGQEAFTGPDNLNRAPGGGWLQRLSSVLFVIFCFELGLFLLIYPWTDAWAQNYFSWFRSSHFHSLWHEFWNNTYFRGAVSGLGVVNMWIAVTEVFRMFARRRDQRR